MKASAPTFTNSDTSLAIAASWAGLTSRFTYSRQMLRVNRLAAAIDMIAAGTSAPMPTAAYAMPVNQSGNMRSNSTGTTVLESGLPSVTIGVTPAAIAMKPSSAIRPSTKL
jgi:hypothetical protein